jgi:hypothetical protein
MIESAEEFVRLRSSDDKREQHRATHDEAPVEIWMDVLEKFPDMTFWVIHNKTVPIEILEKLAKHPDTSVRSDVARKRKLTYNLFETLSKDSDTYVRQAIAINAEVPLNILERLANDSSGVVADCARRNLENRK